MAWLRQRYRSTKTSAKKRGLSFEISFEFFCEGILQGVCEKTGLKFVYDEPWHIHTPSVDRKDSTEGYTEENVQFVTWMYNAAKGRSGTEEQLIEFCLALVKQHLKDGNINAI